MQIFIKDYKNLHDLTIPVPDSRQLILLGKNGVGKTNVLEAIYFHSCKLLDCRQEYAGRYLLSLDVLQNPSAYYPNQELIDTLFNHDSESGIQKAMLAFLEKMYLQVKRPLMRKLIGDALESLQYAAVNKRFDPSALAITRLIILNKILQTAMESGEKYIILLDSPELFAHPQMVDEIITALQELRQQGCMIVVSTHSEQVISRLFTSFAEIIRMDKNEKKEVQIRTIDMAPIISEIQKFYDSDDDLKHNFSRSTHYDQGLLRLLEEKNIEGYLITVFRDFIVTIFSAEIVILGEGASENVLFDYIENVVRPLWQSERRVEFMTCLGKSTMPLYFIFLNGIGIKTFVIYDLDNLDNCVHLAFREAFNRYYRSHRRQFRSYWLQPDLEGFLDIDEPNRIQSMIKPLHIYNKTFLENENNPKLARLLTIMEENIIKL